MAQFPNRSISIFLYFSDVSCLCRLSVDGHKPGRISGTSSKYTCSLLALESDRAYVLGSVKLRCDACPSPLSFEVFPAQNGVAMRLQV